MASSKPYKFSYGEQINQFSPYNYTAILTANTISSLTVPYISNSDLVAVITVRRSLSANTYVSVTVDGTDPSNAPSSNSTFNSNYGYLMSVNLNTVNFIVKAGDVIKIKSNTTGTYVCITFYTSYSF